jgi:hypothetical protein
MSDYIIVKRPKKRRFRRDEPESVDEFTLVDLLRKKKEEAKALEDFLKEQEKLNKKEDKQTPKPHAFTFTEGLLLAFMAQWFLGPMLSSFLKTQGLQ